MRFLRQAHLTNSRILVRADLDVPMNESGDISDLARIDCNIPTLVHLLEHGNTLLIFGKRGRPRGYDPRLSLKHLIPILEKKLHTKIEFIEDIVDYLKNPYPLKSTVILFENVRFYKEEVQNNERYIHKLAELGDSYVNDCFDMCHRNEATITGIPPLLPSYAGFALEKEIQSLEKLLHETQSPSVAVLGGAKMDTKIRLLYSLIDHFDYVLLGGAVANTFLLHTNSNLGKSLYEKQYLEEVIHISQYAQKKQVPLLLPFDVIVSDGKDWREQPSHQSVPGNFRIVDIGEKTRKMYGTILRLAKSIVWNGPMGLIEEAESRKGTLSIYRAIEKNRSSYSVIGGGDTESVLPANAHNVIDHISLGGGAMLSFMAKKGKLPGLAALSSSG